MAKTKRMIRVTSGRLVNVVCYTQAMPYDTPRERAAKNKCSSAARQKLNFTAAWKQVQQLMCCNFERNDLWVTLGFDDDHLPPTRKECKKIIQKFFDRLRAERRSAGMELKYMYAVHELQDDGSRRLHFHFVVNSTAGLDYDQIRGLWVWGDNIEICKICESKYYGGRDDLIELAQYLVRERAPDAPLTAVGDKGYVCSRNLKKPRRDSDMVDADLTVTAPPGAYIIDTDRKTNEYGSYEYLTYLMSERDYARMLADEARAAARDKPKRRRKKK